MTDMWKPPWPPKVITGRPPEPGVTSPLRSDLFHQPMCGQGDTDLEATEALLWLPCDLVLHLILTVPNASPQATCFRVIWGTRYRYTFLATPQVL